MAKRDFYDILGVARNASDDDLKKAYRKLAMQLHPDRNPGNKEAESKFKDVNEAYDVLKDADKRAAYDRFGHAAFEGGGPRPGGPGGGFDGFGGFGFGTAGADFSDVFEDLFGDVFGGGGARRRDGGLRGSDLRYNLTINLEDAYTGKTVRLRIPTSITCETCTGSGAKKGTSPKTCDACQGSGQVRVQQGFFSISRTCGVCGGTGKIIPEKCPDCRGSGRVQKEKTLSVSIPRGVEDGTRIRLAGEGEAGHNGGPAGDLYIFVSLKGHPIFRREGRDLFVDMPIDFVDAALGATVDVPIIDGGRAKISIPEGTQPGQQFRLKSKGMPGLNGVVNGDLFVNVSVEVPTNLTKGQRELLEQFGDQTKGKQTPQKESFMDRVSKFWSGD